MGDKTIQIGNYQWISNKIVEYISNEDLDGRLYSWGEFSVPTHYSKCNGNNLAIRKCTFSSQLFIDCDFSCIDASDSIFIDCLFLNCLFKNANLYKVNFIGTAIIQDNNYGNERFGAGMSQTQFRNSNSNNSILSNLILDGCSFRHSVFENTIFNKVSMEYTSFEDAYFNGCIIDYFDLRSSACRGIIIDNCKIKKYLSSLEKTLGGIGILQILEYCDEIELYVGSDKIDTLDKLVKKLEDISRNFLSEGKLFEFINIMNFLYVKIQHVVESYILPFDSMMQLSIQNGNVNGYPISEKGNFLYQIINLGYETINNNGNKINLDDILYSLKLIFFLNINEYIILKSLLDIYKNEMLTRQNIYSDFLVLSQINHYFHIIGERIRSNKYKITFHNETASWQNIDDRNNFYEFCKQFIAIAVEEDSDFKLISMHEGSIAAIFESFFHLDNIIVVALILGCQFEVKNSKINFVFSPAEGIKTYAEFLKSIIPLLGDKKITEDKFDSILKKTKKIIENLKEYIKNNTINGSIEQNNASKEIEISIKETRKIEKQGEKSIIRETIETQKKITEK